MHITLLLRFIILSILGLFFSVIMSLVALKLINYISVGWNEIVFILPIKKMIIGSLLVGIASWIMYVYQYRKSLSRGLESIEILNNNGYQAEINIISSNIKIPFYKVNGQFFHNYVPEANDISYFLSGIRKIIKKSGTRNIVINLAGSSVNLSKARKSIRDKFDTQLDNILLIDKLGNVIKLK